MVWLVHGFWFWINLGHDYFVLDVFYFLYDKWQVVIKIKDQACSFADPSLVTNYLSTVAKPLPPLQKQTCTYKHKLKITILCIMHEVWHLTWDMWLMMQDLSFSWKCNFTQSVTWLGIVGVPLYVWALQVPMVPCDPMIATAASKCIPYVLWYLLLQPTFIQLVCPLLLPHTKTILARHSQATERAPEQLKKKHL